MGWGSLYERNGQVTGAEAGRCTILHTDRMHAEHFEVASAALRDSIIAARAAQQGIAA